MSKYDINSELKPNLVFMGDIVAGTLGTYTGSGGEADYHDNVEQGSDVIDCGGFGSCDLIISYLANLASTKILTVHIDYAESDDPGQSGWGSLSQTNLLDTTTLATGDTGTGSTEAGAVHYGMSLRPRKRFIKFYITWNLDASTTDYALVSAVAMLGGADTIPTD
jgi:hypothetical protein